MKVRSLKYDLAPTATNGRTTTSVDRSSIFGTV
jgi:hypothetical protein